MKKICTKLVSKKHALKLIKQAESRTLPDALPIKDIAFLYSPYSEKEQIEFFKSLELAAKNGELKSTMVARPH